MDPSDWNLIILLFFFKRYRIHGYQVNVVGPVSLGTNEYKAIRQLLTIKETGASKIPNC